VEVLDRILDKGLVVAGDIKVSLANVELLTIQIRLLVCSIDKAEQIGLDWWRHDSNLSARSSIALHENAELKRRVAELEHALQLLNSPAAVASGSAREPGARPSKSAGATKKGGGRTRA
jgi:hypothetical protein